MTFCARSPGSTKPASPHSGSSASSDLASSALGHTLGHKPRNAFGESLRICRLVAVKDPRLIIEKMGHILAEGALVAAEPRQRDDAFMMRIDLQHRLRCLVEAACGGEQPLELPVGAVFRRHQADRA